MEEARVERRLAAVLAADVAEYSRLMGNDEEGTLVALKACRRDIIDPQVAAHRGRVVKTTGDGVLVEFPSAVDAIRCATDIQRAMSSRNTAIPEKRRIEFRIGINVGDIIFDEGDIYGDGVNIASRVEALAKPGSVCAQTTLTNRSRERFHSILSIWASNASKISHRQFGSMRFVRTKVVKLRSRSHFLTSHQLRYWLSRT